VPSFDAPRIFESDRQARRYFSRFRNTPARRLKSFGFDADLFAAAKARSSRMARGTRVAVALIVLAICLGALFVFVRGHGFDARHEPGTVEKAVALRLRGLAIPEEARRRGNPVPPSHDARRDGLAHFADHCAICHANDGSGRTEIGRGLYPKPPDLRLPATQQLTDGELFYIIERGVPLTGMPGFGTGSSQGETSTWNLVHFIRRIPALTPDEIEEMKTLNPRSPAEIRQEIEEEQFLKGGEPPDHPPTPHKQSGGRK
jgi:mono/diheme cytochrome c family protein